MNARASGTWEKVNEQRAVHTVETMATCLLSGLEKGKKGWFALRAGIGLQKLCALDC